MSNNIKYPTKEEFEIILEDYKLVLVDFWATWCGPCQMIAPIIEELSDKYCEKVAVVKVDIDEQQELAAKYQIMSIPTLILFKNQEEQARVIGAKSIDEYIKLIEDNL